MHMYKIYAKKKRAQKPSILLSYESQSTRNIINQSNIQIIINHSNHPSHYFLDHQVH